MSERVLIVDDEESIVKLVDYNLRQAGYETLTAENGQDALTLLREQELDLIILDVMLPGIDGIEVCRRMRQSGLSVPVIMLTARNEEIDRVLGLEIGADDYVTKPFSPRELVARVRAVLRRSGEDQSGASEGVHVVGDITVDVNKYEVLLRGKPVELTPREFDLLRYLMAHVGRVLSRDVLLDKVWGYEFAGDTRIVDVHISHLRDKLENDPKNPEYIRTVRGVGYKMVRA